MTEPIPKPRMMSDRLVEIAAWDHYDRGDLVALRSCIAVLDRRERERQRKRRATQVVPAARQEPTDDRDRP